MKNILGIVGVLTLFIGPASAYPNGAPWGSADPAVEPNCSSCHFDGEAVRESEAIVLRGLPQKAAPGKSYELTLHFRRPEPGLSGFLLSASAGAFAANQPELELQEMEIRSTSPSRDKDAEWKFSWTAPLMINAPLIFYVGANAANDDASPFGDQIHFRSFVVGASD